MGFFSKVFKGIGKVFKKIGKGIKSAFKKFGRFMGKIGILGQVAMMFILPGIGNAILGTSAAGAAAAAQVAVQAGTATAAQIAIVSGTAQAVGSGLLGGALGSVGVAAGKAAVWVGNKIATVKNVFSNITQGVTETLGNFAKTAGKKLGFKGDMFTNAADNFFSSGTAGGDTAFSKSFGSASKFQNLTTDFSKISKMVDEDIGDPFRSTEQTLAEKIQGTSLDTPRLADGSIDQFSIDSNMSIDSSISKAMSTTDLVASSTPSSLLQAPTPTGDLFRAAPQTMLEKIQATSLNTPRLADGSIDPFAIDPNMPIDSSILEATGKGVAEKAVVEPESWIKKQVGAGVDKFIKTATDIPSQLLNKSFGINQPGDVEYNQYAAYVPNFDTAQQGTYGAQPIMGARDFEQQVTNNTSPYGYTAFQYGNYMAQFGQTA